jgi:hypothetical protein
MANRVPLIVDVNDNNKIKELPVGDNLDLSGSSISQVNTITVDQALTLAGLPVSTFTGLYQDLGGDVPTIPDNLEDLLNVSILPPTEDQFLKWTGTEWQPSDLPPDTDTLDTVVTRGQTSATAIIIDTVQGSNASDIPLTTKTNSPIVAKLRFDNGTNLSDTPATLEVEHNANTLGRTGLLTFTGKDDANLKVTYGDINVRTTNLSSTNTSSKFDFQVKHGGVTATPLTIDGTGITVPGRIYGDITSTGTSNFSTTNIDEITLSNFLAIGTLSITSDTIESGNVELNLGANNQFVTIGGVSANTISMEAGKVNINNTLEVDGDLKASSFPLTAVFENGITVDNLRLIDSDQFNTYGTTVSLSLQSDRKNPPTNNDHAHIEFVGLVAGDNFASYRTVGRIRFGTEDDEAILPTNQSSFFYKFEKYDNTHTPVNAGDFSSIPFVIGYNNTPSGQGDIYKATIVNFENSQDDFIVLGGSLDGNNYPVKLLHVDYSAESVSTSGDVAIGGDTTITGNMVANGTGEHSVGGNFTVAGNLTVNGTTTTINSTTLAVDDLNITVASGATNAAAANGAGLTVDLGSDGSATITYGNTNDRFASNKDIQASNFIGNLTGNASTASSAAQLTTARTINGVSFNGTADITISAAAANSLTAGTGLAMDSGTTYNGSNAITISNTDLGSSQFIFKNIAVAGQTSIVADSNNDTLTFANGTGITITTNDALDTVTVTNAGVTSLTTSDGLSANSSATGGVSITNTDKGSSQNIFKNVASDSGTAVADTNNDTLTLSGGTGISTAVSADTVTITNDGVTAITTSSGLSTNTNATGSVSITNTGVTSISGTANEVDVSASTGSVTVGLPNNVTIAGTLNVNGNTTLGNAATDTLTINADTSGSPVNQANEAAWLQVTVNGATYYIPLHQ